MILAKCDQISAGKQPVMTADGQKAHKDVATSHPAAEHSQAAAARLQTDATQSAGPIAAKLSETGGERFLEVTVRPHDTLRNIGRELYRRYGHHDASDVELKAFELDAGQRNGLSKAARDNLQPNQALKLTLPGLTLPGVRSTSAEVGHPRPQGAAEIAKPQTKAAQDLMKGAASCSGEWSNMVAQWVTHNEVSKQKFVAFNPDDGGHGISVGLLQWNQKRGRLPELLQDWHHKDPAKFDRIFGSYSAKLLKADYVRDADFVGTPSLYSGMQQALADSEFQQVQLGLRNRHIVKSCEVAQDNGFKSLRGRAVVADLFNQIGESGTVQAMRHVSASKPESARIEELKKVTGGRVNGHDRVSSIEEKVKEIWRQLGT